MCRTENQIMVNKIIVLKRKPFGVIAPPRSFKELKEKRDLLVRFFNPFKYDTRLLVQVLEQLSTSMHARAIHRTAL